MKSNDNTPRPSGNNLYNITDCFTFHKRYRIMIYSILFIFFIFNSITSAKTSSLPPAAAPPKKDTAKMTKIVSRNITPGIDKSSYEAQPVTVYLYGDKYTRVEEQPDKLQGLHGLMIIRKPETWSINLMDNTANHYVVDDDMYDMSIPLIPQTANDNRFEGLSYGQEILFFSSATISKQTLDGIPVQHFSMTKDGMQFELYCKVDPLKPYLLKISAKDRPLYQYSFDEYTEDIPVDLKLFEVPSGVKIRRLPPHPSDKSQKDVTVSEDMKKSGDFMMYYYLNPQPKKAGAMLKSILHSPFFTEADPDNSHNWDSTAYFWSKIAQLEPSIIDDYITLFKDGSYEQRCYLLKILQVCGNQKAVNFFETGLKQNIFGKEKEPIEYALQKGIPIGFNPLARPIKEGGDLDYLWMEFMATGKEEPVVKIIETLNGYDNSSENLIFLVNASAAEWSLNSFCRQHEKVMEMCKNYIPKAKGTVKERLEGIVSEIEIENLPNLIPDNKMIKAVVRETTPSDADNPSKPKIFYRMGSTKWHVEKFTPSNSPLTIIVKEPDIWIISKQNEGLHFTGPGTRNYFFPTILTTDKEVSLRGMQLGTELSFMKAKKAQRKLITNEGIACSLYSLDTKQVHVELLCKLNNQKEIPWKLTVSEGGNVIFSCTYDEYESDLKPDSMLFEVPAGVQISEDSRGKNGES